MNYLIADDEEKIIDLIEGYVSNLYPDARAHRAVHGEEALELCSRHNFDFIITDFYMPEKNGFDLIKNLRADPLQSQKPIILLSGHNPSVINLDCDLANIYFMDKPINISQLELFVQCCTNMPKG